MCTPPRAPNSEHKTDETGPWAPWRVGSYRGSAYPRYDLAVYGKTIVAELNYTNVIL